MRETLLFYCQHSLGIGHLTRSFALARALRERFRVVFLNGGRLPDGIAVPEGVECIDLPPLGMDDGHTVISRDAGFDVQAARAERRLLIDLAVATLKPALLLVELFPFGRKKFATEILPMIRGALRTRRAAITCSSRRAAASSATRCSAPRSRPTASRSGRCASLPAPSCPSRSGRRCKPWPHRWPA
jgi:predicted glycosyltransferase